MTQSHTSVAIDATEVLTVLEDLIAAHHRWLIVINDHRHALSRSDTKSCERCTLAQQQIMGEIAELETRRQDLLQIAALDHARTAEPFTITELAHHVAEPQRAKLLDAGDRLLTIIDQTRKAQQVLALAAGALAAHMEGLVRQVATKLQSAATYSPAGSAQTPISAGVDITQ